MKERKGIKGYFDGYEDGITDTKLSILETIEEHRTDDPREVLAAIEMICNDIKNDRNEEGN